MASVPSETSIANAALTLLGERLISSIDDNTKTAKLVNERYTPIREDLLRSHPWNFATQRVELGADATAPVWGFDFAYQMPSDLLRLLTVENPGKREYRVEGRRIVTDISAPLQIEYTASITDPQLMDVMFRQAFAGALAADIAESLTGTTSKVDQMLAIRDAKIRMARYPDGQETTPRQIESCEWLDAREIGAPTRKIPTGSGTPL